MAFWQETDNGFREIGGTIRIPNNDVAKCMYYLNCMYTVIDYDDDNIVPFTRFQNYWKLTDDEDELVCKLCFIISPDLLDNKGIFESDILCGRDTNKFFEIREVRHMLGVIGTIIVAGRTRQVNKVMAYKMSWMRTYYFDPMRRLGQRFNPALRLIRAVQEDDYVIS